MIVTTVMMQILTDIDRFLLSYYQSTGDVGVYSVIYPLAQLLTVGLSALSFIFMPILSELHAEGEFGEMRRTYQVATKWIFFITVPIGAVLVLFPRYTVRYTFGAEYVAGAPALVVLALGFFSPAVVGLNGSALTSVGRTKTLAGVNVATAALNVGVNIILIPQYSYLGAAVAMAVAYTGMNLAYSVRLYQTTGIHPFSASFIRPGAGLVLFTATLYATLQYGVGVTPLWIAIHGVVFACGYGFIIIRFGGVQPEEIMILDSIEERFQIDLSSVRWVLTHYSAE